MSGIFDAMLSLLYTAIFWAGWIGLKRMLRK
jgi:hypothetical protein